MRILIQTSDETDPLSNEYKRVEIDGDGSIEHFFETFIAALVTNGFALDTVKKIQEIDI